VYSNNLTQLTVDTSMISVFCYIFDYTKYWVYLLVLLKNTVSPTEKRNSYLSTLHQGQSTVVTMAKDELDNDALLDALTKEEIGELVDFIDPDVSHVIDSTIAINFIIYFMISPVLRFIFKLQDILICHSLSRDVKILQKLQIFISQKFLWNVAHVLTHPVVSLGIKFICIVVMTGQGSIQ